MAEATTNPDLSLSKTHLFLPCWNINLDLRLALPFIDYMALGNLLNLLASVSKLGLIMYLSQRIIVLNDNIRKVL